MTAPLGLIAGLVFSLLLVRAARRRGPRAARRAYAIGLVVAALVYLGLALAGRASSRWLATEAAGVALFGAAASLGSRKWPAVLAAGWATHVAWDVLLHLDGAGAAYTPDWYAWLCVSFDLVIAGAVVASPPSSRRPGVDP